MKSFPLFREFFFDLLNPVLFSAVSSWSLTRRARNANLVLQSRQPARRAVHQPAAVLHSLAGPTHTALTQDDKVEFCVCCACERCF